MTSADHKPRSQLHRVKHILKRLAPIPTSPPLSPNPPRDSILDSKKYYPTITPRHERIIRL